MKYVVSQKGSRQVVTGLALAGVLVGMASPVITLILTEYTGHSSILFELLGALLVPISLVALFFSLFIDKK